MKVFMLNHNFGGKNREWVTSPPGDFDISFYLKTIEIESNKLREYVFKNRLNTCIYEPEKPLKVTLKTINHDIPLAHADYMGHLFNIRSMLIKAHIDCGESELPTLLNFNPPSRSLH